MVTLFLISEYFDLQLELILMIEDWKIHRVKKMIRIFLFDHSYFYWINVMNKFVVLFRDLRPPPTQKKSVFVKKVETEINTWEDSPWFALSETLLSLI